MLIRNNLRTVKEPKTYKRNRQKCILDPYRKRLIIKTPEEIIRQKVARYLTEEIGVPLDRIKTEQPLRKYGVNHYGRMDIVIEELQKDGVRTPIALVECKAAGIELTYQVYNQAKDYAEALSIKYFFITNGDELSGYAYNELNNVYEEIKSIPSYKDMLMFSHEIIAYSENSSMRNQNSFADSIDPSEYSNFIGVDTPKSLYNAVVNIGECFLDTTVTIKEKRHQHYRIVEDLGLRFLGYGDSSGGNFGTGSYRTVLIEDRNGNNQLISFGVMANSKTANDPIYNNRRGNSVLVVAIDDYKKTHTSLQ